MADRILGPLLKGLERAYQFPSAQRGSPKDFELDLPIQPVQDMMDFIRMASAIGNKSGFWVAGIRNAHVAAGTLSANLDPYNPSGGGANTFPTAVDPQEFQIWIYDTWLYMDDATDFGQGAAAIQQGSEALGPYETGVAGIVSRNLSLWTTTQSTGYANGFQDSDFYNSPVKPTPLVHNYNIGGSGALQAKTVAGNVGTINYDIQFLIWAGIMGISPP